MNSLGIYFGPKIISIVETKGNRPINNIQIPRSIISSGDLEEKVPDEVRVVTLLKDELSKKKIEAKDTTVALSGHDLIIRTFEIPLLSRDELSNAVNFEVRKYIPFKVEDLISDFQWKKLDKYKHKNLILFAGIKKETLDKYLYILNQLEIKIDSIEYAAFAILRLLKLTNVREKGVRAVVNIDLKEEDEVNFMVLEDGFPLFSRDITLASGPAPSLKSEETQPGIALEKIKKEIRISLDYYYRKFPTKKVGMVFFITGDDYRSDLGAFVKELGLDIQFIDANKYTGKPAPFSLSFIKAYSSSLSKTIKTKLQINLLLAKARVTKEISVQPQVFSLLANLKVDPKALVLSILICIAPFIFGIYRKIPLERELSNLRGMRPQVSKIGPEANYETLSAMDSESRTKISTIDNLLKKQAYLTEILDAIRRVIPEGAWLVELSFKKGEKKIGLILRGNAYLSDSIKEYELVNKFLANLKENPIFNKYFKEKIDIVSTVQSIDQRTNKNVTNFEIICQNSY